MRSVADKRQKEYRKGGSDAKPGSHGGWGETNDYRDVKKLFPGKEGLCPME
jgi:hypothetical protein